MHMVVSVIVSHTGGSLMMKLVSVTVSHVWFV